MTVSAAPQRIHAEVCRVVRLDIAYLEDAGFFRLQWPGLGHGPQREAREFKVYLVHPQG